MTGHRAWTLSGGEIRFLHHVGAGRARAYRGDDPAKLYGTSAGALYVYALATLRAHGLNTPEAANELYRLVWDAVVRKQSPLCRKRPIWTLLWRLWRGDFGLYDLSPLAKLLTQALPWGVHRECTDALVTVVDLESGHLRYAYASQATALASSSVPVVSSPMGWLVDGGVREILPLRRPIQDGATAVTAFLTRGQSTAPPSQPLSMTTTPRAKRIPFGRLVHGTIGAMADEILAADLRLCHATNDLVGAGLAPAKRIVHITEVWPIAALPTITMDRWTPAEAAQMMELGEEAGRQASAPFTG